MSKKQQTIGIIGGKGLMGNFFKNIFTELGFHVLISDRGTKLSNKKLVLQSDIILFSVPIHLTSAIMKSIIPSTRTDQLLLDVTSIKTIPMREMLKSPAEVIGLHPMFRPPEGAVGRSGLNKQTVVMCNGRASEKSMRMVRNWFTSSGAKVVKMTAREHDRLMSIIQVLLHFHTIVLGNTMRALRIPLKKTLEAASPIYRLEMDMIARIFSQDPLLYGPIEMLNPETKKVTRVLLKETEKLAAVVLKKDLKKFAHTFKKTSLFLGDFKEKALVEINKLLTHLAQ